MHALVITLIQLRRRLLRKLGLQRLLHFKMKQKCQDQMSRALIIDFYLAFSKLTSSPNFISCFASVLFMIPVSVIIILLLIWWSLRFDTSYP
jgi:hypothetical protein